MSGNCPAKTLEKTDPARVFDDQSARLRGELFAFDAAQTYGFRGASAKM